MISAWYTYSMNLDSFYTAEYIKLTPFNTLVGKVLLFGTGPQSMSVHMWHSVENQSSSRFGVRYSWKQSTKYWKRWRQNQKWINKWLKLLEDPQSHLQQFFNNYILSPMQFFRLGLKSPLFTPRGLGLWVPGTQKKCAWFFAKLLC